MRQRQKDNLINFYCRDCRLEQIATIIKDSTLGVNYFRTDCKKCRRKLVRFIDNKLDDPYFVLSPRLKRERSLYSKDLVQPSEYHYRTLYRKEWEKIEAANEAWEKRIKDEKKSRDDFFEANKYDINKRGAAKATIEAEERMSI